MSTRISPALVIAALAVLVTVAGAAVAAIPDGEGRITGCAWTGDPASRPPGSLRLTGQATDCASAPGASETALTWRATGPAGPPGAAGPVGPAGPAGATGGSEALVRDLLPSDFAPDGQTTLRHPAGRFLTQVSQPVTGDPSGLCAVQTGRIGDLAGGLIVVDAPADSLVAGCIYGGPPASRVALIEAPAP